MVTVIPDRFFPERKIRGVSFSSVHINARSRRKILYHIAGKGSILQKSLNAEIDAIRQFVGMLALQKFFDHGDHLRDRLRCVRAMLGFLYMEGWLISQKFIGV